MFAMNCPTRSLLWFETSLFGNLGEARDFFELILSHFVSL
jgi:hypothetical protein